MGKKYQPQLVQDFWTINSITWMHMLDDFGTVFACDTSHTHIFIDSVNLGFQTPGEEVFGPQKDT